MTESIRTRFWKALDHSPFLMIGLTGDTMHSMPMTAQLDKDAHSAIWFYTTQDSRISRGGRAMAQFASKGHDLFACMSGRLVEETDQAVIDKHWSRHVEAWYEDGRYDPSVLMLRFEIDDAEIWTADTGIVGLFKLLTGRKIAPEEVGEHAELAL
jgi:general stress protein 26